MSDDSLNQPPHDPELIYLQTAERLIAQNRWQLMTAADLAALAAGELQQARDEGRSVDLKTCMNKIYNQALYIACSGDEGPERWNRGYTELLAYLQYVARNKFSDVAEDAVQMALSVICERCKECRSPRAFRTFASWHLQSAATTLRRRDKNTVSLDQVLDDDDGTLADLIPDLRFDPDQQALRREQIARIRQVIEELLREHPRAADQFKAFLWKYRDGLTDEEIARRLGTTVPRVHVLRSRWLKRLRELLRDDDDSDGEHSS